ncbi:hypothetical protein ACWGCW_41050, partial [Streptomyces sp. NPDC054933]
MAVIDRETQTALDTTRDRYGRTVHHHAAAAAHARRNAAAAEAYATHCCPALKMPMTSAFTVPMFGDDDAPPAGGPGRGVTGGGGVCRG